MLKRYALPLFVVFMMVWQFACGGSAQTTTPAPTATVEAEPFVMPTTDPLDLERVKLWNPETIQLDGNPYLYWEFSERTNVLLVVRETTDSEPMHRDMFVVTQEMATVNFQQYEGRPSKLMYQQFDGKSAEEVGKIGDALRRLTFDGSTLQFAITIRPTEVDWHQWIVGGQEVAPNVSWTVQGRELASYIQRVQVQDWSGNSNLAEFWSNNNPGYVIITCAAPYQNETYVYLKEENRPFADQPWCEPERVDGYYFINNSSTAVLETHGLLLQEYWEIQQTNFGADTVRYLTTWDDVLGYSSIQWTQSTSPVFPGATATAIVPAP